MTRSRTRLTIPALLLAAACGGGTDSVQVTVMTRNLYLGGPIDLVLGDLAGGALPAQVLADANAVWQIAKATNFPERAKAIAAEIAAHKPDVVGLQEVSLWRSGTSLATATKVEYDFLALLLGELQALGLTYNVAAASQNFDGGLPLTAPPASPLFIRYTDRDVILTRDRLTYSNARAGNYKARFVLTPEIVVVRGWTAIDVYREGGTFTVINTHLEVEATNPPLYLLQAEQAAELTRMVSNNPLPVLILGDLNSDANLTTTPTYALLRDAGFGDPWADLHPGTGDDPGFTCCNADPTIRADPTFGTRIDHTLYRGTFTPRTATIVGKDPAEKTASGLWPSDHAGVVTSFDFQFIGS
jgi:endonuclease/exonuclease/phosphatase family metal-dependent hydrolase